MSNQLFEEFEPVSAKEWKQKIQYDLKGADYNDTLIWQSTEGIDVKPFYHRDQFDHTFSPIPGHPKDWRAAQSIFIDDAEIASKLALNAIERGADTIYFSCEKEFDIAQAFENFPFGRIAIHLDFQFLNESFLQQLRSFLNAEKATVFYHVDLLGNFARSGNWFHHQQTDHEILEKLLSVGLDEHLLSVDGTLYQNAGANAVQQLAYCLGHANEYLNHYFRISQTQSTAGGRLPLTFKVAVGSNYFFEIAKIRALRILYASLATEYGAASNCHILALPSKRNKTLYDYNCNMLRTTTECMSAILGGANTVCNLPYDVLYHKSNPFAERISLNQLLILKSESYFDQVSNAADGSYYIESLTMALAEKALQLFKDIEKNGGLLQQLKEGTLQKKIKESAQKEQQLFDEGKLVLVGTNKYQSDTDRMKDDLELYPFLKRNPRKTLIEPIVEKRLAEILEQERLSHE